MKTLNRDFYNRDSITVARELLGNYFIRTTEEGRVVGKIVETEGYSGEDDLACHASRGMTKRTRIMYGEAGHLYIYLNYGIFYLTNIVCDKKDFPSAVLIRSAEILEGGDIVRKRLSQSKFVKANSKLASGPGKFSIAFDLTNKDKDLDITKSTEMWIEQTNCKDFDIIETERIGVDYAKHCRKYPWRFYIKGNQFVSKL